MDANLIIRYLTDQPPDQAERAARLFDAVAEGTCVLTLEDVILAEVVWTLGSYYRMSKQDIAAALLEMLAPDGIRNADKEALQLALVLFAQKNLDFADALLAARAIQAGQHELYSFDRDFDRVPGVTRRVPT